MKRLIHSRKALLIASTSLALLGLTLGLLDASGATYPALPFNAVYQGLPAGLASGGGTQLSPLTSAQVATVSVTPADALAAAQAFTGISLDSQVTATTSLGAFTDSSFEQRTSAGQYQVVASDLPCYVVTFSGLSLPVTLGTGSVSHESVIVNAATGVVIEGIKFF
jgi:hypothetical protein